MKTTDRLWTLMVMLTILFSITACEETQNEGEEPPTPSTPSQPVNSGDWQTVPASGGTITKGDISLTFPAGTFAADTKVAIVEGEKGLYGGNKEASPFYQITMPATTAKPVTVKMKSKESGDDIGYVIITKATAISTQKETVHGSYLETSYDKGEYTTTIPILDNGPDARNEEFAIGLGHLPTTDNLNDVATTRSSWKNTVLKSGKVEGVKWEIYTDWWAWLKYDRLKIIRTEMWTDSVGKYIEQTIKQIHKLGFKLNGKDRTIPYYYSTTTEWGEQESDRLNNNWWSCINLSTDKLSQENIFFPMPTSLKQTIIHETLHYYQTDYDPRYWSLKISLEGGQNEHMALCEMGAVWIEKFMNAGKLNGDFQINSGVGCNKERNFRIAFPCDAKDILEIHSGNPQGAYKEQGYALGTLLYQLTKYYKEDENVVDLYKSWKSTGNILENPTGSVVATPTVRSLDKWYDSMFGFFDAERLDKYYLELFTGKLAEDFSIARKELCTCAQKKHKNNQYFKDSLVNKVYPNGCEAMMVQLTYYSDSTLAKSEFVVKQKQKDVHTYLLYTNGTSVGQIPGKAIDKDSIVVSGETIKELKGDNKQFYLFLLTTRDDPFYADKGTIPTNTWCELREVKTNINITDVLFNFRLRLVDNSSGKEDWLGSIGPGKYWGSYHKSGSLNGTNIVTNMKGKSLEVTCKGLAEKKFFSYVYYTIKFRLDNIDKGLKGCTMNDLTFSEGYDIDKTSTVILKASDIKCSGYKKDGAEEQFNFVATPTTGNTKTFSFVYSGYSLIPHANNNASISVYTGGE